MTKKIAVAAIVLLLLAGCDKPRENEIHMQMPVANASAPMMMSAPPPFVPPPDIVLEESAPNALFSLEHNLEVEMTRAAVVPRFAKVRDACLKDKALQCVLTSSSIRSAETVTAELSVALPHDQVAVFEKLLMKRLAEDGDRTAEITSRSSSAENQTKAAADIDRELAQARAYRDQLEELSKRSSLSVDEVLKIHAALIEAQEAVKTAEAAKRASQSSIVLEKLTITLNERVVEVQTSPFDRFWQNAGGIFLASTADMLLRLVNLLPWLPLAFVVAWLAARFLNRWQLRRAQQRTLV